MKGFCGIDIDKDRIFLSFASINRGILNFLEEVKIDFKEDNFNFLNFLKNNIGIINQKIVERKNLYSLDLFNIFINISGDMVNKRLVDETIPLNRFKKLSISDINFVKKYLEGSLDLDDLCIHNFVMNYNINNQDYFNPPIGIFTKKMRLKSLLIYIKNNLYDEINSLFDNFDLPFGGFIYKPISALSTVLEGDNYRDIIVFYIGYDKSYSIIYLNKKFNSIEEFDFGLIEIFNEIEKNFFIFQKLAEDIFNRYISFKDILTFKEITIKNKDTYMNLDINTFNSFIKEYVKNKISLIMEETLRNLNRKDIKIVFLGRLNLYDGFYEFVKENFPYTVDVISNYGLSCSFGAIKYGLKRFLENEYIKKDSILRKMINIYKEYF